MDLDPPGGGWKSGNVPIMKDALGKKKKKKKKPILKGSSAHLIPILWCNNKLKYIIHKGNRQSLTFCLFHLI